MYFFFATRYEQSASGRNLFCTPSGRVVKRCELQQIYCPVALSNVRATREIHFVFIAYAPNGQRRMVCLIFRYPPDVRRVGTGTSSHAREGRSDHVSLFLEFAATPFSMRSKNKFANATLTLHRHHFVQNSLGLSGLKTQNCAIFGICFFMVFPGNHSVANSRNEMVRVGSTDTYRSLQFAVTDRHR